MPDNYSGQADAKVSTGAWNIWLGWLGLLLYFLPLVLEAESAIFWTVSRKEPKDDMVELSWDCNEELLVRRESNRGKELCNYKFIFYSIDDGILLEAEMCFVLLCE